MYRPLSAHCRLECHPGPAVRKMYIYIKKHAILETNISYILPIMHLNTAFCIILYCVVRLQLLSSFSMSTSQFFLRINGFKQIVVDNALVNSPLPYTFLHCYIHSSIVILFLFAHRWRDIIIWVISIGVNMTQILGGVIRKRRRFTQI